jgi:hypothetical protein
MICPDIGFGDMLGITDHSYGVFTKERVGF